MRTKRSILYCLLLIVLPILFSACTKNTDIDYENAPEGVATYLGSGDIMRAIIPVNEAIYDFRNLAKGTIQTEYTGTLMPASKVIKDEMKFQRADENISYTLMETDVNGVVTTVEDPADQSALEKYPFMAYLSETLDEDVISKYVTELKIQRQNQYTKYILYLDPSKLGFPENFSLKDCYCTYTVNSNGALVDIDYHRTIYYVPKKGKLQKTEDRMKIRLTDYTEQY